MAYKASNMEPPKPEDIEPKPKPDDVPGPEPTDSDYTIRKGDSWWKIAKENLPPGASNKEILAYTKQLASENGAEHLYSGKYGSPGWKPDTWHDLDSGDYVGKDVLTDADKLYAGEVVKIVPFKGL